MTKPKSAATPKPDVNAPAKPVAAVVKAPPAPKQSKDGPPVVAAETAKRPEGDVEKTQVEGFAPPVAKVDGEDGSDGELQPDPALGVEPGQAIDQSGGNPIAQNLTTTHQAEINTSPKIQANGRYAEAGPDHGDLPPDPTMASDKLKARVDQVRDGKAHEDPTS